MALRLLPGLRHADAGRPHELTSQRRGLKSAFVLPILGRQRDRHHEVAGDVVAARRAMVQVSMGGVLWAPRSLPEEKRDESIRN